MRHVIVGNSAAGLAAAESIRKCSSKDEIVMVTDEAYPAYARCLISEIVSGARTVDSIRLRSRDFYEANGIRLLKKAKAVSVDPKAARLMLESGDRIAYDRLLIATGSRTLKPPIPGVEKSDVFGLKSAGDAERIAMASAKGGKAVIIGGGLVGLEAAFALCRRGLEVTVAEGGSHILPSQFDKAAARILESEMAAEGIRLITGTSVREITDPPFWSRLLGGKGKGVVLDDGRRLGADVVVLATGTRANAEIAASAGARTVRGLVVDEHLMTSLAGVFAAGDVIEVDDTVTGKRIVSAIWPNAVAQGRYAGLNMAGVAEAYHGDVGMQNVVEFKAVPSIAAGVAGPTEDDPGSYAVMSVENLNVGGYRKVVLKDGVLMGFILVGDIMSSGVLMGLMRKKAVVSSIAHKLLNPSFSIADIGHDLRRTDRP